MLIQKFCSFERGLRVMSVVKKFADFRRHRFVNVTFLKGVKLSAWIQALLRMQSGTVGNFFEKINRRHSEGSYECF